VNLIDSLVSVLVTACERGREFRLDMENTLNCRDFGANHGGNVKRGGGAL